jgi:hypothetical protein
MTIQCESDEPVDEESDCGSCCYRKLYKALLDRLVDHSGEYEHLRP